MFLTFHFFHAWKNGGCLARPTLLYDQFFIAWWRHFSREGNKKKQERKERREHKKNKLGNANGVHTIGMWVNAPADKRSLNLCIHENKTGCNGQWFFYADYGTDVSHFMPHFDFCWHVYLALADPNERGGRVGIPSKLFDALSWRSEYLFHRYYPLLVVVPTIFFLSWISFVQRPSWLLGLWKIFTKMHHIKCARSAYSHGTSSLNNDSGIVESPLSFPYTPNKIIESLKIDKTKGEN